MKYEAIRDQIKTGDMLLWSDKPDEISRHDIETGLVRVGTMSQWTHVGVALVEHARVSVMDITRRGCAARPLSKDIPFYWISSPQELPEAGVEYAAERWGEMVYQSNWTTLWNWMLHRNARAGMSGVCSDYALGIYEAGGYNVEGVTATPAGLCEWAMTSWPMSSLIKITG